MHISHQDISLGRLIHLRRRSRNDDAGGGRRRNERWTPIPKSERASGGMEYDGAAARKKARRTSFDRQRDRENRTLAVKCR